MDSLTHTLLAVALVRAGLRRWHPNAACLMLVSANLPDVDLISRLNGPFEELQFHNGYTHSIFALPVLAAVSVALSALILRKRLALWPSTLVALAGLASHLLLDCLDSFGIRALLPFSSRWLYLDLNGFYDGVFLLLLTFALLWPWFVTLVWSEIGRRARFPGQGSAILVLLTLSAYEGARWGFHRAAINKLSSEIYAGQVPLAVSALPDPNNPVRWTGVVETADSFRVVKTEAVSLGMDGDSRVFRKPELDKTYSALVRREPFRYMTYFCRFPIWEIEPLKMGSGIGRRITMTDVRFELPWGGNFHASALLAADDSILETGFGSTALSP